MSSKNPELEVPMAERRFVERLDGIQEMDAYPDHLARYRFALQWAPGARILDICCGAGYGSFLMAAAGARQVCGVDISEEAIEVACTQPRLPNLNFCTADACSELPAPGTWDLVTCFEGIEHVSNPAQLLRQIHQALSPRGLALLSTPNADAFDGHSGNPFHISEMPEAVFRRHVASLDWTHSWYAQIENEDIWRRPRWQVALMRSLPQIVRRWKASRVNRAQSALASRTAGEIQPRTQQTEVDDWYPMPWEEAVRLMYAPPPKLIIAVCQRH